MGFFDELKFENRHAIAIAIGLVILMVDLIAYRNSVLMIPLIIIALTVSWIQFWIDYFKRRSSEREFEAQFLELVRNLVSAVESGMPVSTAVIHVSNNNYGGLTPHVQKLKHQLEWSIPFHRAFTNFAIGTRNPIIKRAVATVIEAERAGGNLEDVLEAITESLVEIKRIADQRRASIHGQVIQSYIIFFIFLGVMVVIQNLLIPYMSSVGGGAAGSVFGTASSGSASKAFIESVKIDYSSLASFVITLTKWFLSLDGVFRMLTLIQGLFAGLIIGKLSEGNVGAGMKHSLALMTIGFIVISFAQAF